MKNWTGERVRTLRRRLGLSQAEFARELGVRQQTVSEWETGRYEPRGASRRVLSLFAEQRTAYDQEFENAAETGRREHSDER